MSVAARPDATTPVTHSADWHTARSAGIGASEIATICGIGRWGSRWAIWAEKTGVLTPDPDDTGSEAMRMGLRMEDTLARFFCEDTGLHIYAEQLMVTHVTIPWVRATIDILVGDNLPLGGDIDIDRSAGPVQLKHTDDPPWCDCGGTHTICPGGGLPVYYQCQGQWEMLTGGWSTMWFAALHSHGRFRIYQLDYDPDGADALLAAGRSFWEDHVATGIPPALDGPGRNATADALKRVYQGGGGELDVDDLAEQLGALRWLKAEAKSIAEQITDLENVVKAHLGDCEVGLVAGQPLVTWKRTAVSTIDVKPLKAEAPEVAARFTVEGVTRRLDIRCPCPVCGDAKRPQDLAKHLASKHPTATKEI